MARNDAPLTRRDRAHTGTAETRAPDAPDSRDEHVDHTDRHHDRRGHHDRHHDRHRTAPVDVPRRTS